jgi:hypothetical protein
MQDASVNHEQWHRLPGRERLIDGRHVDAPVTNRDGFVPGSDFAGADCRASSQSTATVAVESTIANACPIRHG